MKGGTKLSTGDATQIILQEVQEPNCGIVFHTTKRNHSEASKQATTTCCGAKAWSPLAADLNESAVVPMPRKRSTRACSACADMER